MSSKLPSRNNFPVAEKKYKWLPMLLDAFHVVDCGIKIELENEEKNRGQKTACKKGCANCCLNSSIPFTGIELAGISWYATEVLKGKIREKVKLQLLNHEDSTACPFLIDKSSCSIYPIRPLACRGHFVFSEHCEKDEDPFITRNFDTWTYSRDLAYKVAEKILPY